MARQFLMESYPIPLDLVPCTVALAGVGSFQEWYKTRQCHDLILTLFAVASVKRADER